MSEKLNVVKEPRLREWKKLRENEKENLKEIELSILPPLFSILFVLSVIDSSLLLSLPIHLLRSTRFKMIIGMRRKKVKEMKAIEVKNRIKRRRERG